MTFVQSATDYATAIADIALDVGVVAKADVAAVRVRRWLGDAGRLANATSWCWHYYYCFVKTVPCQLLTPCRMLMMMNQRQRLLHASSYC